MISDCRSTSAACSRPYGHATMQVCSRKYAKSNSISADTAATTANPPG
jgi:hypothetical protein